MKAMASRLVLYAVLCCLGGFAWGQAPEINWTQDLHAGWRVHRGDNPAFAQPGFDDAPWKSIDLHNMVNTDMPRNPGIAQWYRLHLHLPMAGPADLLLKGEHGAYEVYVDGRRVSPAIVPSFRWSSLAALPYPLRSGNADPQEIVVAVRSYSYLADFQGPGTLDAVAGDPTTIARMQRSDAATRVGQTMVPIAAGAISILAGLLLLALFLQQRMHREYLWLGLGCIFSGLSYGLVAAAVGGFVADTINAFVGDTATYLWMVAQIEFVYAFTGKRPGRFVRCYEALLVATPLIFNPLAWRAVTPYGTVGIIESLLTVPVLLLVSVVLVVWYRRGSREAGMLFFPMLLANATPLLFDIQVLFHSQIALPSALVTWNGVEFSMWSISQVLFLFAIGIVLFFRFTRISRQQAFQMAELESARTVQDVLVPEKLPDIPGLRIESVYHPAQQVGGDFFQIIPLALGEGTLVVIGDVSGKGLPAAMNVALIVGALRTLVETTGSPGNILEGLNRRLCGRSAGFTTCLALRVMSDGRATLANAGHIPPYRAGEEVAVANGLPLGLTFDAAYDETELMLTEGDQLTLMTDGVVEAQDPRTRALFGFERTAAISSGTAAEIARAALDFGQEDDIAVLTLQYLPV